MPTSPFAWASLAILLGTSLPPARILRDASFRRAFPGAAWAVLGGLLGWAALATAVLFLLPTALPLLAGIALSLCAAFAWRARPAYGRGRGLPPGSLSLISAIMGLVDREYYSRLAVRHGPVFKASQLARNVVCVVGLERGQRLLREHPAAIGPNPLPFSHDVMGGFLRYMDDETHDLYGGLIRRALSQEVLMAAEPAARAAVERELQALPTTIDAYPQDAISPDPHLERMAYEALVCALFGLRKGTGHERRFSAAFIAFTKANLRFPLQPRARRAMVELREIVGDLLKGSPAGGPPDLEKCALTELYRLDSRLPDRTCIDNLLFMLKIGTNNATGLLRWLVVKLGEHPEWRARLAAEATAEGAKSFAVADAFILETLRLAQSEYIYRRLLEDVEFEGLRLPKGWMIRLCVAESHRDPRVFAEPEKFSDRFVGRNPDSREICPFGFGRHTCNGVGLVYLVSRSLLSALARRPELVVYGSERTVRDLGFSSHWRPGPRLEVVFRSAREECPVG